MGWWRISSIDMGAGNLLLVKCIQALSSWIKKSSLFCFCKFLCLLYLRIYFCLKRAKTCLKFSIKSIFNRYSMRTFQRAFNNLWILIIFESILFLENLLSVYNWNVQGVPKCLGNLIFFIVPVEIVYSLFNFFFDILGNNIYLNYVPKFG